jgi:hypothetical protein
MGETKPIDWGAEAIAEHAADKARRAAFDAWLAGPGPSLAVVVVGHHWDSAQLRERLAGEGWTCRGRHEFTASRSDGRTVLVVGRGSDPMAVQGRPDFDAAFFLAPPLQRLADEIRLRTTTSQEPRMTPEPTDAAIRQAMDLHNCTEAEAVALLNYAADMRAIAWPAPSPAPDRPPVDAATAAVRAAEWAMVRSVRSVTRCVVGGPGPLTVQRYFDAIFTLNVLRVGPPFTVAGTGEALSRFKGEAAAEFATGLTAADLLRMGIRFETWGDDHGHEHTWEVSGAVDFRTVTVPR